MSKRNHPGSRKVKKIVRNAWSEQTIVNAIHKIQSVPGSTTREVVKEFGVNECTLRFRLKRLRKGEELKKAGRECTFTAEEEKCLAKCIGVLCKYGFSPSMKEIQVRNLIYIVLTFFGKFL